MKKRKTKAPTRSARVDPALAQRFALPPVMGGVPAVAPSPSLPRSQSPEQYAYEKVMVKRAVDRITQMYGKQ